MNKFLTGLLKIVVIGCLLSVTIKYFWGIEVKHNPQSTSWAPITVEAAPQQPPPVHGVVPTSESSA